MSTRTFEEIILDTEDGWAWDEVDSTRIKAYMRRFVAGELLSKLIRLFPCEWQEVCDERDWDDDRD